MNIVKGRKYIHKTLGLVEVTKTRWHQQDVWVKLVGERDSLPQRDDWGYNSSSFRQLEDPYMIRPEYLISIQEHKVGPIIIRIRKLWKESNWVKNNPQLKY